MTMLAWPMKAPRRRSSRPRSIASGVWPSKVRSRSVFTCETEVGLGPVISCYSDGMRVDLHGRTSSCGTYVLLTVWYGIVNSPQMSQQNPSKLKAKLFDWAPSRGCFRRSHKKTDPGGRKGRLPSQWKHTTCNLIHGLRDVYEMDHL